MDLDLVLTEYYKERLESQLKNRETYTNGLILTKSIDLTGLQIPTDWTLCTKSSSTKPSPFLPSPNFSPLSLSPNIALLLSTSPITSLFLFQSHFYPPPLYHLCAELLLVSEMTDTIKDNKMSKEGIPNPDSTSLPPVIQVSYILTMPYLGRPGTSFFEGSNITDFFNRYNQIYTDFRVEIKEKMKRLP